MRKVPIHSSAVRLSRYEAFGYLEWIQEERLLFSVTPRVTLTHVSYPPNFLHVAYLTETRGGAEHNYAEEARCSRWLTVRGPLIIPLAYLLFYFPTVASWSVLRFHGAEIAMFSVISNVSIFLCLVLFIRKAGRYTRSSWLSERFPWRVKQLRAGLSGHISKLVKGSVLWTSFFVSFCRISTNIYRKSSRSVQCVGR